MLTHTTTDLESTRVQQEGEQRLAHELANILTPVVGISEMLTLRAAESGDRDLIRLVKILRHSAAAARDLVLRLGEIQVLEHGRRQLRRHTGNLVQLLESTVRSIARTSESENVQIESTYSVDDAQVEMDFDLLPVAFGNIIRNAVQHVASEPALDERIVHVCLTADGPDYVVQISNPGAPIPADRIGSFFDKFNSDRKRKPFGAGLGTTYARLVTWAHGGRISVLSDDERGTVVTIWIPKAVD